MSEKEEKIKDKQIVARLIKMYIMNHQGCKSNDISRFLASHKFGLKQGYTAHQIAQLIKMFLDKHNDGYAWFRNSVYIEKKYGKNNVYFVKV